MKSHRRFLQALCAASLGAVVGATGVQPAFAHGAPRDVSSEIDATRTAIVSADVLLAPPHLETRGEVKEEDLPAYACRYHVTEKQDLDQLVDLLAGAGLVEVASSDPYEMRTAVYLHTRAGATLAIATSQDYANAPASGRFNGSMPIAAKSGYEIALRTWAAQRTTTTMSSGRCAGR